MTGVHARALAVVLWALLSSFLSGCVHGSDCAPGDFKCDGNSAFSCEFMEDGNGSYYIWRATNCGAGVCKLDAQDAFCALSSTVDPNCGDRTFFCAGTSLVQCHSGYATATHDCATGVNSPESASFPGVGNAAPYCVAAPPPRYLEFAPTAFCATEPDPDPDCPRQNSAAPYDFSTVCVGNSRLSCFYGYTVEKTDCDVACCGASP